MQCHQNRNPWEYSQRSWQRIHYTSLKKKSVNCFALGDWDKGSNERKASLTEMSLPTLTKALLLHEREVEVYFSDFSLQNCFSIALHFDFYIIAIYSIILPVFCDISICSSGFGLFTGQKFEKKFTLSHSKGFISYNFRYIKVRYLISLKLPSCPL